MQSNSILNLKMEIGFSPSEKKKFLFQRQEISWIMSRNLLWILLKYYWY